MRRITASIVLAAFLHEQILLAHDPYLNLHNPPVPEVSVDTLSSETQEASSDSHQASVQDFLAGTDASPISATEATIEPPTLDPIPSHVNTRFLTLSGTKPPGTGIFINGMRPEELTPKPYPSPSPFPFSHPPRPNSWAYTIELRDLKTNGDTQTLLITTRDRSGHESLPVRVQVTLDRTRPSFSLLTPIASGDTVPHTGLHLEGLASDEHVLKGVYAEFYFTQKRQIRYKEAATYDPVTSAWSLHIPQDKFMPGGTLELYLYAQDEAGNRRGKRLRLVTEGAPDKTQPQLAITSHRQGEAVSVRAFLLSGTVSDNDRVQTVQVMFYDRTTRTYFFNPYRERSGRYQAADYDPLTGTWSIPLVAGVNRANHEITATVFAQDRSGNRSVLRSTDLSVGELPPLRYPVNRSTYDPASRIYQLRYTIGTKLHEQRWQLGEGETVFLIREEEDVGSAALGLISFEPKRRTLPEPQEPELENPNSPKTEVTTVDGFKMTYQEGKVVQIEKPGEFTMSHLDWQGGRLSGGLLTRSDGMVYFIDKENLIYSLDSQGRKTVYDESGRTSSISWKEEGREVKETYSYRLDSNNRIVSILVTRDNRSTFRSTLYDADGSLQTVFNGKGNAAWFEGGFLSAIRTNEGIAYRYKTEAAETGFETRPTVAVPESLPSLLRYDEDRTLSYVKQGSLEIFFEDNLPHRVLKDGVETQWTATENEFGSLADFLIERPGYSYRYGGDGSLDLLKTPQAEFSVLNGVIQSMTVTGGEEGLPKGSVLEFRRQGDVRQTVITYPEPDGRVFTYAYDETQAKDILREVKLRNGTIQSFGPDSALKSLKTADGKFYEYAAAEGGRIARLTSWELADGRILYFKQDASREAPVLDWVEFSDGRKLTNIVLDSEGRIDQADESVFDENHSLLFVNHYEAGKLKKRTFPDGTVLLFGPSGAPESFGHPMSKTYSVSYQNSPETGRREVTLSDSAETLVYSTDGKLLSYVTDGMTFNFDDRGAIRLLTTPFGEVERPAWDGQGRLTEGTVRLTNGPEYKIEGGAISKIIRRDKSQVTYQNGLASEITTENETLSFEYVSSDAGDLEQITVTQDERGTVSTDALINFLIRPEHLRDAELLFAAPIENLFIKPERTTITMVNSIPPIAQASVYQPNGSPSQHQITFDSSYQPETIEIPSIAPDPNLNKWDTYGQPYLDGPYPFATPGAWVEGYNVTRGMEYNKIKYDLTTPGTYVGHYYFKAGAAINDFIGFPENLTFDLSSLPYLVIGLQGEPGTVVAFELMDASRNRHQVLLHGIDEKERLFKIDLTSVPGVDLTRLASLALVLESDRQAAKQGTLEFTNSYSKYTFSPPLSPVQGVDERTGAEFPSFHSVRLTSGRGESFNYLHYASDSEAYFHYDLRAPATKLEVTFDYDRPETPDAVEYEDLSGFSEFIFGAEFEDGRTSPRSLDVYLEDAHGNRMLIRPGFQSVEPTFFTFDTEALVLDLKRIRSFTFWVAGQTSTGPGDGRIWLRGIPREGALSYTPASVDTDELYVLPKEKVSVSLSGIDLSTQDFLNLSVKTPDGATDSRARLTIGQSSYTTKVLSPGWNHLLVPLSHFTSLEGEKLEIAFEGSAQSGYFLDNLVFFKFRDNRVETLYPKLTQNPASLAAGFAQPWKAQDEYLKRRIPDFSPVPEGPSLMLLELGSLLTVETELEYDGKGTVQQAKTADGRTIVLKEGGELDHVILKDGSTASYSYDQGGNLGSVVMTDSRPIGEAAPPEEAPLSVTYEYGKIRELTRQDKSSLTYEYEFVTESTLPNWLVYAGKPPRENTQPSADPVVELTVVKIPLGTEPESYEVKVYRRDADDPFQTGQLLSVMDPNGLVTVYDYDTAEADSPLKHSQTYFKGRLQSESSYDYRLVEIEDLLNPGQAINVTHTFVTDEEGTTSEFDHEGNLARHFTQEGYQYEHLLERENLITVNGASYLEGALFRVEDTQFTIEEAVTSPADPNHLAGALLIYPDGHRTFFVDGKPYLSTRDAGEAAFFDPVRDAGTEPFKTEAANFALAKSIWAEAPKTLPQNITPEEVEIVTLVSRETDQALVRYEEGELSYLRLKEKGLEVTNVSVDSNGRLTGAQVKLAGGADFIFKEGLHVKRTHGDGGTDVFTPEDESDEYLEEVKRWSLFKSQAAGFIRPPDEQGQSMKTDLGTALYGESGRLLEVHLKAEGITLKELEFNKEGELISAKAVFQGDVTGRYRDGVSLSITEETESEHRQVYSYFDSGNLHYETSRTKWNEWKEEISAYLLDPSFVIETEYNSEGAITTLTKADRSVSIYDETGNVDQIYSFEGRLLIDYTYEGATNTLLSVTLVDARKRLEEDTAEAKREILRQKVLALEELAKRTEQAIDKLKTEIESKRQILLGHRAQLDGYARDLEGKKVRGRDAKRAKSEALNQLRDGMNQVSNALSELDRNLAEGISEILAEKDKVSVEIDKKAEESLGKVQENRTKYLNEIVKQELTSIVFGTYRDALGRDPGTEEIEAAMSEKEAGTFDRAKLRDTLIQSDEYRRRRDEVKAIKRAVSVALILYTSSGLSSSAALSKELGLSADEVVSLSRAEADQIRAWLNAQDLHFGHSAFLALQTLLKDEGKITSEGALAAMAILIDILTGVITPFEEGELKLSLFSLERVAAKYGVKLYPAQVSYEDLKRMVLQGKKVMVHLEGDHYTIVTGFETVSEKRIVFKDGRQAEEAVEVEKVITLERNKGESGEEVIVTKDQFLSAWEKEEGEGGYVLTPVEPRPASDGRLLSTREAQSVRGAFFFFIAFIISAIIAAIQAVVAIVIAAVMAVIAAVSAVISAVVGVISGLISAIGQGLAYLANGLQAFGKFLFEGIRGVGALLLKGLKFIGSKLYQGIRFIGSTLKNAALKLGTSLRNGLAKVGSKLATGFTKIFSTRDLAKLYSIQSGGASLKATLIKNALGHGLNFAVSKGLDSLGIKIPGINLLTSFVTGGIGGLVGDFTTTSFITGALQKLLLTGISTLALHLDLPPPITRLMTSVSSLLIGNLDNLPQAFQTIGISLAQELALSGLTALGDLICLDPRITALIGTPVSATVGAIGGNVLGLPGYEDVLSVIKTQTFGGIVSIGTAIALDAIGVPPIATSFIAAFLGSLAVGLSGTGAAPREGEIQAKGESILTRIGEGLKKFGRGFVNVVGSVISFGQKVIQGVGTFTVQGFKKTISAFSSIFSRETQEGIYQDEVGLRGATITQNGNTWTWQNGSSRIDYNTQTGEAIETFGLPADGSVAGVGGTARVTGLSQDDGGSIYYQKLTYETAVGGGAVLNQTFDNGKLTGWSYGIEGTPIITVKGPGDQTPWMGEDGRIFQGDVEINPSPVVIKIPDDLDPQRPTLFDNLFFNFRILDGKVAEASVEVRPGASATVAAPTDTSKFVFGNGFNNEIVPENTPDKLMPSFVNDLANKDFIINLAKTLLVPMYETTGLVGNILDWAQDFIFKLSSASELLKTAALGITPSVLPILANALGGNDLVEEVKKKLLDFEKAKGILDKGIAFAHSGFFAPLLGALEKTRDDGSYFDVQTVINYEGPNVNWNDHIDNPNLKRIINVWGTAPNEIIERRADQIPGCNTNGSVSCIDPSKKPVVISDFGPPSNPTNLLSEWSKAGFTGSAPGGIENVNILILNARHNDFSYDATAWNDPGNQFEPEMIAQEINRKTNKFMRLLYQFSLTDQTRPGDLRFFLENTTGISFDSANQVWVVDPSQLEF